MRQLFSFALKAAVSGLLLYFAFARVNFNLIGQRLDAVECQCAGTEEVTNRLNVALHLGHSYSIKCIG